MTGTPVAATVARSETSTRRPAAGAVGAGLAGLFLVGNAVVITWLWIHGGGLEGLDDTGELLTSLSRITGLLSAYLALVQVVLLARVPWVERRVGFDRLTGLHRWNGHACIDLVIAHVVLVLLGYAALDELSFMDELRTMTTGYPGMVTAWVGTGLLVLVIVTSVVIVRRRLAYEAWFAVHLLAYAGIALAWFHQVTTGNEFALADVATAYWTGLYIAAFALLIVFRIVRPAIDALRFRMRVAEVVQEGPGVVSVRIAGRHLHRMGARGGQFFMWRFLDRTRWWSAHPYSLSEAPRDDSLRITVKALGGHSAALADLAPGTPVLAEGPFGVFTADRSRSDGILLVGGGVGITPVRAMLEDIVGDCVVVVRAMSEGDLILHHEVTALAAERGARVVTVVGDHRTPAGRELLSPAHLRALVPDVATRDVFVCGPPGMTDTLVRNLRRAGVSRRRIHTQRFAL